MKKIILLNLALMLAITALAQASPPVADAGTDIICQVPEQVYLDGSGSYDPDPGDELTYSWTQLQGPTVVLSDANTAKPYFDCIEYGLYIFELVVSDGISDSQPDEVCVATIDVVINQLDLSLGGIGTNAHYGDISNSKVVYAVGPACDYSWDIKYKNMETGQLSTFSCGGGTRIDTQPKIDGDVLVWCGGPLWQNPWGHEPSNFSVFARNISTTQRHTLRQYTWSKSYSHPVVSGDKIVWLEHLNLDPNPPGYQANNWYDTAYNICGVDISIWKEPNYFTIAENVGNRDPYPCYSYSSDFDDVIDISGNIVVWEAEGDIYGADLSDLSDIRIFTICNNPARQFDPAISDNIVIWTDERNDGGDIYGADISDTEDIQVFEIVTEDNVQKQPAIDDCPIIGAHVIAYVDGGEKVRVYYYVYDAKGNPILTYQDCDRIKACSLSRFYKVRDIPLVEMAPHGNPRMSYLPYGMKPAIDSERIIWLTNRGWRALGISLDIIYSVAYGPIENLTTGKKYDYIEHAIYFAADGDEIVVSEGIYHENIDFAGKNLTLRSTEPNNPAVVAATIINGDSQGPVVTFSGGEEPNCVFAGFTITGGNKGIYCYGAFPTIANCTIDANGGIAIDLWHASEPTIINCDIIGDVIIRPFVENLATGQIYEYIQPAIDDANNDDEIVATAGVYQENIDFRDKNLTLRSIEPNDPNVMASTVINGDTQDPTVIFSGGQDANSVLAGFTITGGDMGVYCYDAFPTITNCTIDESGRIAIELWHGSNPTIIECTIMGDVVVRPIIENLTTGQIYDYIQDAIDDANNSDRIVVPEGICKENIDFKGKNLILRSTDPNEAVVVAATIIEANGPEPVVTFSGGEEPNCLFTGFTIVRGSTGIYCSDASPTITKCSVNENGTGIGLWNSSSTITDCTVTNNGGAGIELFDGSYVLIANCIITDNGADGIHYEGDSLTTGPTISNCIISENKSAGINFYLSKADINNCTITGNGAEGIIFRISFLTITNCILWDNLPPQILKVDLGTATVNYSDIQGGWAGQYNINADPCFVEPQSWDPNQGLVSYWKFDESSGTAANDSTGHNQGTIHGAEWITGQVNSALSFDDVNDYVDIGDKASLDLPGHYTLMFWVKFNSFNPIHQCVLSKEDYITDRGYSFQLVGSRGLRWRVNNSTMITASGISAGHWAYITVTTDGKEDVFYVDGVEKDSTTHIIIKNNNKRFMIGKRQTSTTDEYLNGAIDEVVIYNRGLSPEEIQQHYQNGLGEHSLPVPDDPNNSVGHGDYHLLEDSPCINTGDENYIPKPDETDLDGRPRILLGRIDMGAYEFNHIPVADAGPNQVLYSGFDGTAQVTLDGTGSYDDDGHSLTYFWSWTVDSNTYEANGVSPTIELPVGTYAIQLTVNDGIEDSEPNKVVITIIEPIETHLWISPQVINRHSHGPKRVTALVSLPEGVTKNQIDENELLRLYYGDIGIESVNQNIFNIGSRREGTRRAVIFAFFDRAELLAAIIDNGRLELQGVGKLKTGQYFYGYDNIRIKRSNRWPRWRRRW